MYWFLAVLAPTDSLQISICLMLVFLLSLWPVLPQVSLPCQPPLPWVLSLARRSCLLPPTPWAPRCPLLPVPRSDTPPKYTLSCPEPQSLPPLPPPSLRGERLDRCHSGSPHHIQSVWPRLTNLLAGGCCLLRKERCFFGSFSTLNECVNLTSEMNVLCKLK